MQYIHPGDAHWPFAHRTVQTITLSETALLWEMTLRNDATGPNHSPFDFHTRRLAHGIVLNHCLDGWSGAVTITRTAHGLQLRMTASPLLRHLVVYRTIGQPWLCIEPVSHATGALSLPELHHAPYGARMLAPGATEHAWMRFQVISRRKGSNIHDRFGYA